MFCPNFSIDRTKQRDAGNIKSGREMNKGRVGGNNGIAAAGQSECLAQRKGIYFNYLIKIETTIGWASNSSTVYRVESF